MHMYSHTNVYVLIYCNYIYHQICNNHDNIKLYIHTVCECTFTDQCGRTYMYIQL